MAFVGFLVCLSIFFTLPLIVFSAYAENSWNIFLNHYEGSQNIELFSPLELPMSSGDSVTWINQDSTPHKIVSGVPDHPDYSGEFFSTGLLSPGNSFSETFDDSSQFTGYYYFCEIHPWFTGKLFFEDRENILHSTLDISYDVINSESLQISGLVESVLATTGYEIMIFDSKNNLIYQKLSSFEPDATFDVSVDISSSIWDHDENYLLKLVYGVPSESTNLLLIIPLNDTNPESKLNALEFCTNSEIDFIYYNTLVPYWFSQTLCWYGNGLVVEKEIFDSVNFFKN